jgi:triacylglycerol esterase/lipase EstA (alpha/beta hydrolase family)
MGLAPDTNVGRPRAVHVRGGAKAGNPAKFLSVGCGTDLAQGAGIMLRQTTLLAICASLSIIGCAGNTEPEVEEETVTQSDELSSFTSPEFWGQLYLNKYARQLKWSMDHIEAGPAPIAKPRTVLLITGVTIKAAWLDPIAARLRRDGFKTVVYEPPGLLSGSLFQASADLGAVVDRVRAESGEEKIDILAECTGGLISRHYIQSLGGDKKVSRLVTFVSPQNGINKLPLVSGFVSWPALRDLTPNSAFLKAVQSKPLPADVAMTSIYTCTDEYIQPYRTSIVNGATNIGLCNGFVGHFQTMYDPQIYLVMHDALVKPLPAP